MGLKIIDNKRIEMTEDEWNVYQEICRSYDRPHFKGEDLFVDLFETDDRGIIVFIKPPVKQISMEIFFFVSAIFQHQHMRLMEAKLDGVCKEYEKKLKELNALLEKAK